MKPSNNPFLSVIIPSLNGVAEKLEKALREQSLTDFEIIPVVGVSPVARARNQGAAKAKGDILVFMDDDALPGNEKLLETLVRTLEEAPEAGVVGVEERLPQTANRFQRRLAVERPRGKGADKEAPQETLLGINTTCWALNKELFTQLGGFNETMIAGDDYDFLYRGKLKGRKHYIAAKTWVVHSPPPNIKIMFKKYYWYGMGDAQNTLLHPEWNYNVRLSGIGSMAAYIGLRTLFLVPNIFIPISFKRRSFRLAFRPLQALSSYAAALGYVKAWRKNAVKSWPLASGPCG